MTARTRSIGKVFQRDDHAMPQECESRCPPYPVLVFYWMRRWNVVVETRTSMIQGYQYVPRAFRSCGVSGAMLELFSGE
jgi:hypothetical protein